MSVFLFVLIAILCGVITLLFDYSIWKFQQWKEMNESWKALNEKLEKEGKERWDKRK